MTVHLLAPDSLEQLVVSGDDAARFLQGQITCDIEALDDGHVQWAAVCTNKGRVIAPFVIFRWPDGFRLIFQRGLAQLFTHALARYLPFYKCRMEPGGACSGLIVEPADVLEATSGQVLPGVGEVAGSAAGWTARLTTNPALLCTDRDQAMCRHMCRQEFGTTNDTESAARLWKLTLMQAGHFPFEPGDTERYTPQELHYDRQNYISFSKGCYTGQEIVARMHYRGKVKRQLYLATLWAQNLPIGQECVLLDAEGKSLGPLLHPVRASADCCLALVSLPVDFDTRGQPVTCPGCERVDIRPF